jgi:hypothetical protein
MAHPIDTWLWRPKKKRETPRSAPERLTKPLPDSYEFKIGQAAAQVIERKQEYRLFTIIFSLFHAPGNQHYMFWKEFGLSSTANIP